MAKDWPDSLSALCNLAHLLHETRQHARAARQLASSLRARLLQPGTDTARILQQFANVVHASRVLDPLGAHSLFSDVLALSKLCPYVSARPDAV